jgi:hypothetical protein
LEELDRFEQEERDRATTKTVATIVEPSRSLSRVDWSLPSDFAFDLGLLADLGIPGNVEMSCDTQSNF